MDAAPEPRELIWPNLGYRRWERRLRQGVSWAAFFLIVAFYVPVVAAIQGLLQVPHPPLPTRLSTSFGLFNVPAVAAIQDFFQVPSPSTVSPRILLL